MSGLVSATHGFGRQPLESFSVAIGIGCRLGCAATAIEALVRQALDLAPSARPAGLFTIEDKVGETGLRLAADRLGMDLVFLSRDALRAQAPFVRSRSERAERRFGVPSVAEAAALAGAAAGSVLIVPRITALGATCAIAGPPS
jgi:cobalt-precorrin 5A hydrolase